MAQAEDWTPPDEPEHLRPWWPGKYEWGTAQVPASGGIPLPLAQRGIHVEVGTKATEEIRPDMSVLLIKAPPGIGKTHLAVEACQERANAGERILFCADRHSQFQTLAEFEHFRGELWYEWLPIHERKDENDPIPTTCRYARAMNGWMNRGYPAMRLCTQLCRHDHWIGQCPFRAQHKRKEPIVFAMHQHLVFGVSRSDFDMAVVDELPIDAFVRNRHVPPNGIQLPGIPDVLRALLDRLYSVTGRATKPMRGRPLLDEIGDALGTVYDQIAVRDDILPIIPDVHMPGDVQMAPYWYVQELLETLIPEHEAWRHGWKDWVSRVSVSDAGLLILGRGHVWKHLPYRTIVLDATGQPEVYRQIFDRDVDVYAPVVERPGRVYQIVGRLNGAGILLDKRPEKPEDGEQPARMLTKAGRELLGLAQQIAGRYTGRVGVVTFKDAAPEFAEVFGADNVVWFGNLRGTNQLADCEALIVAGSYAPNSAAVMETAAALYPARIRPFAVEDDQGRFRPVYSTMRREYRVKPGVPRPDGVPPDHTAWRDTRGYWDVPELAAIHEQDREAEMVQAIHRARPNIRECDVWVLSSIPTSEPLDGIWDDPPELATGAPEGIPWRVWARIGRWLDEQWESGGTVTYQALAEVAQVDVNWAQRNQWLQRISAYQPDRWESAAIVPVGGKGRPRTGIRRPATYL